MKRKYSQIDEIESKITSFADNDHIKSLSEKIAILLDGISKLRSKQIEIFLENDDDEKRASNIENKINYLIEQRNNLIQEREKERDELKKQLISIKGEKDSIENFG